MRCVDCFFCRLFAIVPLGRRGGANQLAWGQVSPIPFLVLPSASVVVSGAVLAPTTRGRCLPCCRDSAAGRHSHTLSMIFDCWSSPCGAAVQAVLRVQPMLSSLDRRVAPVLAAVVACECQRVPRLSRVNALVQRQAIPPQKHGRSISCGGFLRSEGSGGKWWQLPLSATAFACGRKRYARGV